MLVRGRMRPIHATRSALRFSAETARSTPAATSKTSHPALQYAPNGTRWLRWLRRDSALFRPARLQLWTARRPAVRACKCSLSSRRNRTIARLSALTRTARSLRRPWGGFFRRGSDGGDRFSVFSFRLAPVVWTAPPSCPPPPPRGRENRTRSPGGRGLGEGDRFAEADGPRPRQSHPHPALPRQRRRESRTRSPVEGERIKGARPGPVGRQIA